MKRTAIIMAGGSGERFWPLSRMKKPKQLLPLESEKMMIEESIERISPLIPPEDIFIITGSLLLKPIRDALPQLPPENVVAEPYKRNTAPCLALGASYIEARYAGKYNKNEISIAVLTADQSIRPIDGFRNTIEAALEYVEANDAIATIGIVPDRPETGYGYIELDGSFDVNSRMAEIIPVIKFHEKPDIEKAKEYLLSGRFLWNSGMFFWRLDTFEQQMVKHIPEVGGCIKDMTKLSIGKTSISYDNVFSQVEDVFEKFPNISIDFGLMEKADNVVVAKALFQWDDIGSWDSLDRIMKKNESGNIIQGIASLHDVRNSTIVNKSSNEGIIVAGIGLENFVIVVTDDAVLVCPKDRVQEVKKCVEQIRDIDGLKWL